MKKSDVLGIIQIVLLIGIFIMFVLAIIIRILPMKYTNLSAEDILAMTSLQVVNMEITLKFCSSCSTVELPIFVALIVLLIVISDVRGDVKRDEQEEWHDMFNDLMKYQ